LRPLLSLGNLQPLNGIGLKSTNVLTLTSSTSKAEIKNFLFLSNSAIGFGYLISGSSPSPRNTIINSFAFHFFNQLAKNSANISTRSGSIFVFIDDFGINVL